MIETKALTKQYGDVVAVNDLTLRIEAGQLFGFIGPNGAGKTTTMRILATLLEPTGGHAFVNGLDVRRHGREVRELIGYMPDFIGVYADLKVHEYLDFFAAAFDLPRRDRKRVVGDVLELTDLTAKASAMVDSLSRGMQQRLSLARVLVHDPKVLILDEPASGLDPRARIEIRELLMELRRMGKTIMLSSHILSELEQMCDHVGIIEQGRLVFNGTMDAIHERMGLASRFEVCVAGEAAAAQAVLAACEQVREVRAVDGVIRVQLIEGAEAALIARLLVGAGIDVLSLNPEKLRLDEAFLQLTKGLVQ